MKIKKGQKFRLTNINPDWYQMGVDIEYWNSNQDTDIPKWINGELYIYDERFCNEHEVVRQSWKNEKGDMDDYDILEEFCGYSWGSVFHDYYGLLVEDHVKVVPISEDEYKEDCESVIDTRNIRHKTIVEIIK